MLRASLASLIVPIYPPVNNNNSPTSPALPSRSLPLTCTSKVDQLGEQDAIDTRVKDFHGCLYFFWRG